MRNKTKPLSCVRPPADYLEAVAAHPAIGDKQALRDKFAPSRSGWESTEQAAAAGASEVSKGSDVALIGQIFSIFISLQSWWHLHVVGACAGARFGERR